MGLFVIINRHGHRHLGLLRDSRAQFKDLIVVRFEELSGLFSLVTQTVEVLDHLAKVGPAETLLVHAHFSSYEMDFAKV
jgi:hypothetical protein